MTFNELKHKYQAFNIAEKLIVINSLAFIVFGLLTALLKSSVFSDWFVLSKDVSSLLAKPWSILTYAFIHFELIHFVLNMVVLYYVSRMFLTLFSAKKFLNVYILGAIVGGLLFLLSFNVFSGLVQRTGDLVGASASVMAILICICAYRPQMEISVFTIKLRLWQLGVFFVVLDIVQIPTGNNSGGHIAHLGGALLGYVYANQLKNGNDMGRWLEQLIDSVSTLFKKSTKPKMRTVHKTRTEKKATHKTVYQKKRIQQEQIDAILDKISKSGYESLSKEEKEFLFKAGEND